MFSCCGCTPDPFENEHVTTEAKDVCLDGATWSYQACPNVIDFAASPSTKTFDDGLVGWGDLALQGPNHNFTGTLGATPQHNGISTTLKVTGKLVDGKLYMRAFGEVRNEGDGKLYPWIYDYIGYLVPIWTKPAQLVGGHPSIGSRYIVGSVIREKDHPGSGMSLEMHPAGQTGSFWMVLHATDAV